MTISMYKVSVPIFVQLLTALSGVLGKAAAHAQAKQIDPAFLLGMRLYPDMYPLVRQGAQGTAPPSPGLPPAPRPGAAHPAEHADELRRAREPLGQRHRLRQGLQAGRDRR